jgi:hypothetical protein
MDARLLFFREIVEKESIYANAMIPWHWQNGLTFGPISCP